MIHYFLISILLMADYLFTYVGIKIGFVYEANLLLRWLFELDLFYGILIRLVSILFVILLFRLFENRKNKDANVFLGIFYSIQFVIMALHSNWIYMYALI